MDIVTRLKMFLEQAGISNSQFADTCDIPRPTLSQLLNGRNKKVSDEVIGKIHRAYPSLNVMWLMFGDGEMLLHGSDPMTASEGINGEDRLINNESRIEDNGQRAISFEEDEPMGYRGNAPKSQQRVSNTASIETLQSIMRNVVGRSSKRGATGDSERRVVNIFVFYNDGRFEQFEPA
jgi:transcriptional regulator with XRE-family HTH domain